MDSLDDEGERFEDFVKDNMLPVPWYGIRTPKLCRFPKVRCVFCHDLKDDKVMINWRKIFM